MIAALIAATLTAPCPLRWNLNPPAEVVTHYRVFRGLDQVGETMHNRIVVELPADQPSTLTVIAYNATGASEPSDPYTVIPVTPETSPDLKTWTRQRTFFVEATPSRFFRFSYPLTTSLNTPPAPSAVPENPAISQSRPMQEDTPFAESAPIPAPSWPPGIQPSLPPGVPAFLPDGIESVLGGRPIPMRVGRVAPAAAEPPAGAVAAGFSPTVTGASPLDLSTQAAIADCRSLLSRAIAEMARAESELPAIIARIEPAEDSAARIAHFDLSEVRRFLAHLTTALAELRA